MSPRKLTESDKNEILDLYRMPRETTSTLAERYSVSSSTISRFLKSRLPDNEYEELIQQKRLSRTPSGAAQVLNQYQQQKDDPEADIATPSPVSLRGDRRRKVNLEEESEEEPETTSPARRSRRRRSSASETELELELELEPEPEPKLEPELELEETPAPISKPMPTLKPTLKVKGKDTQKYFALEEDDGDEDDTEDDTDVNVHALEEMLGEDLADLDEDLDEDEDDEDDEDDWEEQNSLPHLKSRFSDLSILPLSEAAFPRSCYLVIDRAAELITRPLEEFSDLGDIPPEEFHQETLPVFDNHKIARRFSKRSQRVIKVPDSQLLQKARPHLQAKGITRLLLDGQVYSLVRE
ncbi:MULTISPECIES: transposase [Spirulina sp. CCY15215]|uniref:transposase n=1 Tax=Spirulina sp. CCY15215 TaxID=2767591 RepID=UPI00194F8B9A|nr:transposase [Spirulina major]